MKKITTGAVLVGLACLSAAFGAGFAIYLRPADATRNSAGTMSNINGPFTAGQVIASSLLNNRYSDIETEITNSLDRSGRGGMLAALRGIDGTLAAPAFSFTSETGSGLFRNGAGDVRMSILGALRENWTTTGVAITGTLSTTGTLSVTGTVTALSGAAGSTTAVNIGRTATEGLLAVSAAANNFAQGSVAGDIILRTSAGKLWFDTNNGSGTPSLAIAAANGGVIIGGGTAISASYRGTTSWTPGSIASGATTTTTIAMTGVAAGADCLVVPPSPGPNLTQLYCYTQLNQCTITATNPYSSAQTPPAGTYACRIFNP